MAYMKSKCHCDFRKRNAGIRNIMHKADFGFHKITMNRLVLLCLNKKTDNGKLYRCPSGLQINIPVLNHDRFFV